MGHVCFSASYASSEYIFWIFFCQKPVEDKVMSLVLAFSEFTDTFQMFPLLPPRWAFSGSLSVGVYKNGNHQLPCVFLPLPPLWGIYSGHLSVRLAKMMKARIKWSLSFCWSPKNTRRSRMSLSLPPRRTFSGSLAVGVQITTNFFPYKRTGLYKVPAHHLHDTQPTARLSFDSMDYEVANGTDEQDVENPVSAGTEVNRTPATSAQAALPYSPVGGVGSKNSFKGVKSDKQKEKTTNTSGISLCRLSKNANAASTCLFVWRSPKAFPYCRMSLLLVSQTTYSENRPVGVQKRELHPHVSFSVSSASSEIFRVSGRSCPKRHYMTDMPKVRVQTTTHLFFCLFGEDSSNIRSAGLDPGHVLTACALHGSYITQTSKLAVGVSMP